MKKETFYIVIFLSLTSLSILLVAFLKLYVQKYYVDFFVIWTALFPSSLSLAEGVGCLSEFISLQPNLTYFHYGFKILSQLEKSVLCYKGATIIYCCITHNTKIYDLRQQFYYHYPSVVQIHGAQRSGSHLRSEDLTEWDFQDGSNT